MRTQQGSARRRRAFSLLEAVLVMAILAVVAAMAAPRYAQAVSRYGVDHAAKVLMNDLSIARQRARTLGARQTVVFSELAETYEIAGLASLDAPVQPYRVSLASCSPRAEIVTARFGAGSATSVTFDGYGVPDGGGSIVLQCGDARKTVTLDAATGRAK